MPMNNKDQIIEFFVLFYTALTPLVTWIDDNKHQLTKEQAAFLQVMRRSLLMVLRWIEKQHGSEIQFEPQEIA